VLVDDLVDLLLGVPAWRHGHLRVLLGRRGRGPGWTAQILPAPGTRSPQSSRRVGRVLGVGRGKWLKRLGGFLQGAVTEKRIARLKTGSEDNIPSPACPDSTQTNVCDAAASRLAPAKGQFATSLITKGIDIFTRPPV
jgi:hypothetical protein